MHISYCTVLTILVISTCSAPSHAIFWGRAYYAVQTTNCTVLAGLAGSIIAHKSGHDPDPTQTPLSPYYADLITKAQEVIGIPPAQCVLGTTLQGPGANPGEYHTLTNSIHLNEEKLNTRPYGYRWLVCLHEATHRAQWLRPDHAHHHDLVVCEREADKNALKLAQCHHCVRQFATAKGIMQDPDGYVSRSDCKKYEDRYLREGKVCPYHANEGTLTRLIKSPVYTLLYTALHTRLGYQFFAQALYNNTVPLLAEQESSLDPASGDLLKQRAFFPAPA